LNEIRSWEDRISAEVIRMRKDPNKKRLEREVIKRKVIWTRNEFDEK